jgi:outer membrane protein assembly factor BamB
VNPTTESAVWQASLACSFGSSSPVVDQRGVFYMTGGSGAVCAVNGNSGQPIWTTTAQFPDRSMMTGPMLLHTGSLLVRSTLWLGALNATTGNILWQLLAPDVNVSMWQGYAQDDHDGDSGPGVLYCTVYNGGSRSYARSQLVAINVTQPSNWTATVWTPSVMWALELITDIQPASPLLDGFGAAYVPGYELINSVNLTAIEVKEVLTPIANETNPYVSTGANGTVFIMTGFHVGTFSSGGSLLWQHNNNDSAEFAGATVTDDGSVIVLRNTGFDVLDASTGSVCMTQTGPFFDSNFQVTLGLDGSAYFIYQDSNFNWQFSAVGFSLTNRRFLPRQRCLLPAHRLRRTRCRAIAQLHSQFHCKLFKHTSHTRNSTMTCSISRRRAFLQIS